MEETQDEWCFQIKKCSANVNLFPRKLFRSQYHYFSNQCRNTTLINPMLGWIKKKILLKVLHLHQVHVIQSDVVELSVVNDDGRTRVVCCIHQS